MMFSRLRRPVAAALFGIAAAIVAIHQSAPIGHTSINLDVLPATLRVTTDQLQGTPSKLAGHFMVRVATGRSFVDRPVRLDVDSSIGIQRFESTLTKGTATFAVPRSMLTFGSHVQLRASTESEVGSYEIIVPSGIAENGVIPIIGPHHMIADGHHSTTVSILATDVNNNAMKEETPISLLIGRPDGTTSTIAGTVRGLIAGISIPSGTRAGFTSVRVAIGEATGPEAQVLEVAGPPVKFALLTDVTPVANGRSLVEVRTERLVDSFGNVVTDGTLVVLHGAGPDGAFSITSTSIDGSAVLRMRAPIKPGVIDAVATVAGTDSKPLRFAVGSDVGDFPVSCTRRGSLVKVRVGPITSALGGFVPEGTPVSIKVGNEELPPTYTRDGFATVEMSANSGTAIVAQVLGRTMSGSAP
jgi:hypothetical protein